MTFDSSRGDLAFGIVGTGIMGRGIAQIAALAGCRVLLFDARPDAAHEARSLVIKMLGKLAEKGIIDTAALDAAISRLEVVGSAARLGSCAIVIEAIVEDLAAKRELFNDLEQVVGDQCILATNTSSLAVTAIAAGCRTPGRVAGFHFFNPVPLMKIVEVIDGAVTEPWVADGLMGLARRMGHTPVRAKDTPGFIVNHAGRGYAPEALRIIGEGVADFETVDQILRESAGFRMGPFELLDLTGLDVSHPAMESIYDQYYQEPRYRPSPIARQRMVAGLLGRKSGRGFYAYDNERRVTTSLSVQPASRTSPVWVAPGAEALGELVRKLGAEVETEARPSDDALCVVAPLGADVTTETVRLNLDARRVVAIDTLLDLNHHRTLMTTPITDAAVRKAARGLFASDGTSVSVIHDSAGFVVQRVLANIINIACDMAQQSVASPDDIDRAVVLGLAYPFGPLAWGDRIGSSRILSVLNAMHEVTGEPRYRPSPWLRRRALLGISLLTPEG